MTEYTGQGGLAEMQELVQRVWSPASRLHLGDLAWERSANAGRAAGWRTAVWRDGEEAGQVVAWGWLAQPGHLLMTVDDAPYYTHHWISLDEVAQGAAVHRAAWSDLAPSSMSEEAMGEVMSTWPYRPELDWVVENEARALYQSIGFRPGSRTLHLLLG